MVRFKNRYLVMEMVWKDGRIDEAVSECTPCATEPCLCVRGFVQSAARADRGPPTLSPRGVRAAEAVLLGAVRDSVQQNFGDYGLGCALASFQGEMGRRAATGGGVVV